MTLVSCLCLLQVNTPTKQYGCCIVFTFAAGKQLNRGVWLKVCLCLLQVNILTELFFCSISANVSTSTSNKLYATWCGLTGTSWQTIFHILFLDWHQLALYIPHIVSWLAPAGKLCATWCGLTGTSWQSICHILFLDWYQLAVYMPHGVTWLTMYQTSLPCDVKNWNHYKYLCTLRFIIQDDMFVHFQCFEGLM